MPMKHYAVAYTLMALPNCGTKHRLHRNSIHRGMRRADDVRSVETQLIDSHPGRRVSVRYIEEIEKADEIMKLRPAYYDVNSHLWWEIGCEGECGECAGKLLPPPPVDEPEVVIDEVIEPEVPELEVIDVTGDEPTKGAPPEGFMDTCRFILTDPRVRAAYEASE